MGNIISLSISPQDKAFLAENKEVSPSKLFRQAITLYKRMPEFINMHTLVDFYSEVLRMQEHISFLGKEILRREERIESLQDVLANKEVAERRIRALSAKSDNSGSGTGDAQE